MNYSLDEIGSEEYFALCEKLVTLAKNDEYKNKIKSILFEGRFGDYSITTGLTKNNPGIERSRRLGHAFTLATNPETFDSFMKYNINLYHGTNSNALSDILKYGMQSGKKQEDRGALPTTGEEWSRAVEQRSFISFTDDIDVARDYASHTPKDTNKESFGVIIGISSDSMHQLRRCRVQGSFLPEVGIMNQIPLEHIKSISVPEDKVEFVKKLLGDKKILVNPINLEERFYGVDDLGNVMFSDEMFKQFTERNQNKKNKFSITEMLEIAKTRRTPGIRSLFGKLKENDRGKINENESRDK